MNYIRCLILASLLAFPAACLTPGCQSAPSAQKGAGLSLLAIGAARDAAMQTAALMLRDGRISREQWIRIAEFHDERLAPAYRLAVAAVKADLSSLASADLTALLQELLTAISALKKP